MKTAWRARTAMVTLVFTILDGRQESGFGDLGMMMGMTGGRRERVKRCSNASERADRRNKNVDKGEKPGSGLLMGGAV